MIITAVRKYPNPISRGLSVIDIAMILTTLANVPPIPCQQERIVIFSTVQYFKSRRYQMYQIDFLKKQEMLFSIVLRFGNMWFLLCLERLDADWLNSCGVT